MDTHSVDPFCTSFAHVELLPTGAVQILHSFGCWTTFNPTLNALALCTPGDRRRIYVHCRLSALTAKRGAGDTLRYALTAVEMYALQGGAE